MRMRIGGERAEISIWLLLANPGEKWLKPFGLSQRFDRIKFLIQFLVRVLRMQLFMARLTEGRSMMRFAASLFWFQVMKRDQEFGNCALTQGATLRDVALLGHSNKFWKLRLKCQAPLIPHRRIRVVA